MCVCCVCFDFVLCMSGIISCVFLSHATIYMIILSCDVMRTYIINLLCGDNRVAGVCKAALHSLTHSLCSHNV